MRIVRDRPGTCLGRSSGHRAHCHRVGADVDQIPRKAAALIVVHGESGRGPGGHRAAVPPGPARQGDAVAGGVGAGEIVALRARDRRPAHVELLVAGAVLAGHRKARGRCKLVLGLRGGGRRAAGLDGIQPVMGRQPRLFRPVCPARWRCGRGRLRSLSLRRWCSGGMSW